MILNQATYKKKSYIRHSVWGIGLDVDFKGDFVIVDKAPFWISYILKHSAILTSEQLCMHQKRTSYYF